MTEPATNVVKGKVIDENGNPVSQNLFASRTGAYLFSGAPCGSGGQVSGLPAGTYSTNAFVPRITYTLPDGAWVEDWGGGWVLCPAHNIQPEVPPENIPALYRAGAEIGRYS